MTRPLTDDQRAFQETAQRFAREKIAPGYMKREAEARLDRALVLEMGALGLIGADLPERYGGLGEPSVTAGLAIEALAYGDINVSYVPLLASLNGQIIARHAAPELAGHWIPRIVAGEALFCIALTEPRGGSDAANLALSARRDGDSYVIKGEKSSISMADQADAAVVFARTGPVEAGARGVSAFLVPMNTPGISTTRFKDLGSHAIGRGSIFFDEVRIPASFSVKKVWDLCR
jgi:cyclohexanecarboxyl-CoA dehydrogenase